MLHYGINSSILSKNSGILVDSGSSVHLFKNESVFTSWDNNFNPNSVKIVLADGTTSSDIKGKGTVEINVTDATGKNHSIKLNNVLFMPSLEHTGIISVERCMDANIEVHFIKGDCYLMNNGTKIPLVKRDKLYYVSAIKTLPLVQRSALDWHNIMGHLNFRDIYRMPQMVDGMSITHKNKRACITCIEGKSKENLSRNPDQRADSPFSFVHSDVLGPMNIHDSIDEANYLITFVCDYSNFITVYTMQDKTGVPYAFEKFLQFTARFGKVKRLRSDQGPEYTSHAFEDICRRHSIFHETSVPYTPSMNGTAERSFGTLSPKARCLRIQASLPNTIWPLAYKYAAFLYNRSPVERINSTPFELIYGYKPDIRRIHQFGAPVHTLNLRPETKMDSRTVPGVFVGIDYQTSGFTIWYPEENICRTAARSRVFFINEGKSTKSDQQVALGSDGVCEMSGSPSLPTLASDAGQAADDVIIPGDQWLKPRRQARLPAHQRSKPQQMVARLPRNTAQPPKCDSLLPTSAHSGSPEESQTNTRSLKDVRKNYPNDYRDGNVSSHIHSDNDSRPSRNRRVPSRYGNPITHDNFGHDYCFNISALDYCYNVHTVPRTYNEAMKSDDFQKWKLAMTKEYDSLLKHQTFILVDRPKDHDVITGRWVFSNKLDINPISLDLFTRAKARWVARGFLQKYGESFTDTYAPMSRMPSIRIMMFFCAQFGFLAFQLDVETAYLNAPLDHKVYIEQPAGFTKDKSKVCLLRKSLYGLKQSAKLWNDTIHNFLLKLGFTQTNADLCLYMKQSSEGIIFLIIWVDDIIILSNNVKMVDSFKEQISKEYKVKDLGKLKYFLGIEFKVTDKSVQMSQSGYCKTILERFGMMDSNPMKIPCEKNIHDELREHINSPLLPDATRYRELVGSLIYLQQVTRPDISFIVNILGQQMSKPTQFHWELGLKALRYLKGTINFTLNYNKADKMELTGYADADWGNGPDRKSQSGYCFYLSPNSSPISWSSRKQNLVATSTCDAEYVALSEAVSECIWLQQLIKDTKLKEVQSRPANMLCDNTSAIALANNPSHHKRSKHIDVKHHHVRDHMDQGTITITHVPTNDNIADGFTKALAYPLFKKFKTNCTQPTSND